MKKVLGIALALFVVLPSLSLRADEGMWMIQALDKALEKQMKDRGLKLSAGEIYNADAPGTTISDAVVSLDFSCTGSMISSEGLMITNHHCAYSDVYDLSSEEHNYLKDGFWAMRRSEEVPIIGKRVLFLKKVVDVTERVAEVTAREKAEGRPVGSRRLSSLMEKEYSDPAYEVSFYSMWKGSKYYMMYYQVYEDVRLAAAPPVSISAFGGDIDNWDWPQHKGDFALYRIYTAPDGSPAKYSTDNVPLHPKKVLTVSTKGVREGDYTMVIGYPGTTDRYSSAAKLAHDRDITLHYANIIRGQKMDIVKKAMESSESLYLKYADRFFSLSNAQELYAGREKCFHRFDCEGMRRSTEKELRAWIEASSDRKAHWGGMLDSLDMQYTAIKEVERNRTIYRECLVSGSNISNPALWVNSLINGSTRRGYAPGDTICPAKIDANLLRRLRTQYEGIDLAVEKELVFASLKTYLRDLDPKHFSDYQKEVIARFGGEGDAICNYLWDNSVMSHPEELFALVSADAVVLSAFMNDPLQKFLTSSSALYYNNLLKEIEGSRDVASLGRAYTHALYEWRREKGEPQYPDANSSLRITYGRICGIAPQDAVYKSWYSTPAGILEKYDPSSIDFTLTDRQKSLLEEGNWLGLSDRRTAKMHVNFMSDNDITGGNSGSPVLNARGELIGLAFDGNTESLASDAVWCEGYTKCISVDIRYVLWILRNYAPHFVDEMTLK